MIAPLDPAVASQVWFGALNEVVTRWVLTEPPTRLEEAYPTVRAMLLRGIGVQVPTARRERLPARAVRSTPGDVTKRGRRWSTGSESGRARGPPGTAARDGRAPSWRLERPILVSLALPAPASDPLDFFARGSECGDRLF